MNYHHFKVIAFFAVFCFWGMETSAQNFVRWNAPSWNTTNMLVRDWRSGYVVGYMEDLSGNGYFFLKDYNPIAQVAALPSGIVVTDFRIMNDSIFFCGRIRGEEIGIVGFAYISWLFAGNGAVKYGKLIPLTSSISSDNILPKKMDVYTYNGITAIAFVGEMVPYMPSMGTRIVTTTVGCAYYDGTDWNIDYYRNTTGDMEFIDVAASSSYVVAMAKSSLSTAPYAHVFRLSHDIVSSPLSPGNAFQITGNVPLGDIVLEDISATDFVLAYHCNVGGIATTELQQFRVDPTTQTVSVQLTLLVPHGAAIPYTSAWAMKQLRFDGSSMRILLLQDAATTMMPTGESTVFSYSYSGVVSGYVDVFFIPGVVNDRIDTKIAGGYWAIGNGGGVLTLSDEILPPGPVGVCRVKTQLECTIGSETSVVNRYSCPTNPFTQSGESDPAPTSSVEFISYCNE